MEEKTVKFKVHAQGELELAVSCSIGKYYVNLEDQMFYFEPKSDEKPYEFMSSIISIVAAMKGSKVAQMVLHMHAHFLSLKKENVTKVDDEKCTYDISVEGEMQPLVDSAYGTLYGNPEYKCCYFESAHKGFMQPIEKKKFISGLQNDLAGDDEERKDAAETVLAVIKEFTELHDEDIVPDEAS